MIDGNITAVLQKKSGEINEIGERVNTWKDMYTLNGYLDLVSGDTSKTSYLSQIQQSTHVFICDYADISKISPENGRAVINGNVYRITLIDDPMELHRHIEIYLKYEGGQDGN